MVVSIGLQWGLFLPCAYLLGPRLGYGMTVIWAAQVAYRSLQALVLILIWRSRTWINVDV
jgi:Na+-driven multidrug efflux pump